MAAGKKPLVVPVAGAKLREPAKKSWIRCRALKRSRSYSRLADDGFAAAPLDYPLIDVERVVARVVSD